MKRQEGRPSGRAQRPTVARPTQRVAPVDKVGPESSLTHGPPGRKRPRGRLNQIVLVPASLLPFKAVWQELMHDLGAYAVLIILPTAPASVRTAFERVGRSFVKAGYDVTTMSAERFRAYCQTAAACHDQPMEYPRAR